ncbi:hypothetical protein [Kitasatospora griseola]|uniref:hypothetical protein n=1 Tax=Kitasatospora griseola TaxID=2064 RepID=UPI0019ACFEF9|nr:hypothetical protein [Kitasatospora griseola]GGQ84928.1 hypothetical protein GCM10010195_45880 [Kitasatospora griseola]
MIAARAAATDQPRRVAGHLDTIVVVEVAVLEVSAVEQQFVAGGDAEVAGASRKGDFSKRLGTVRVVGVGSDPDQERHGEHGGRPHVVGAHAAHSTCSGANGRAAGVEHVYGLPDVIAVREVLPRDFVEQEFVLDLGLHGGHHRTHIERPAHERGQVCPLRQRPAHRQCWVGSPLAHVTSPRR